MTGALLALVFGTGAGQPSADSGTWSIQTATQTGGDSRGRFTWQLDPGTSVTDYVNIQNLGTKPLTVRVYASDAITTQGGGFDLLPAATPPVDLGSWIRLDHQAVALGPGQSMVVPFTLSVPSNATPGDHPGGIVAALSSFASAGADNQVRVEYRVGVRAYARITGPLLPQLSVSDFRLAYAPTLNPFGGGTLNVSYTLSNPGNVRLSALQRVQVSGPLGLALGTSEPVELAQALPGQSYVGTADLPNVLPAVLLNADLQLEPRFVDGTQGPELATITATDSVWAPPWPQLLLLLSVFGGGIGARRALQRRRTATAMLQEELTSASIPGLVERLNVEYQPELLLICQGVGGQANASAASVSNVSPDHLDLLATVDGASVPIHLPWGQPLSTALAVERQLLRLSRQAPAAGEGHAAS